MRAIRPSVSFLPLSLRAVPRFFPARSGVGLIEYNVRRELPPVPRAGEVLSSIHGYTHPPIMAVHPLGRQAPPGSPLLLAGMVPMDDLTARRAEAVRLRTEQGLSHLAIATTLDCCRETVARDLHHEGVHGPSTHLKERRAEVARLRTEEGLTHQEIADEMGLTRAMVTRDLAASGLRGYTPGAEERRDQAVKLYAEGVTQPAIAKHLGCSQSTVTRDLLIAGEPGPRPVTNSSNAVTCPKCGWEGGKDWASLPERGLSVAAKAIRLASVPGANPVDSVIEAAGVEHHVHTDLVRNRARWLLGR